MATLMKKEEEEEEGKEVVKMVTLMSYDGVPFKVEEAVISLSGTIKQVIDDGCAGSAIPLPNVSSSALTGVLAYCRKHAQAAATATAEGDLKEWDKAFINGFDVIHGLYELLMAANYLDVKGLLDLICQTVAGLITGRSVEEIRKTFGIKNDFSPEEEAAIRSENAWAFTKN